MNERFTAPPSRHYHAYDNNRMGGRMSRLLRGAAGHRAGILRRTLVALALTALLVSCGRAEEHGNGDDTKPEQNNGPTVEKEASPEPEPSFARHDPPLAFEEDAMPGDEVNCMDDFTLYSFSDRARTVGKSSRTPDAEESSGTKVMCGHPDTENPFQELVLANTLDGTLSFDARPEKTAGEGTAPDRYGAVLRAIDWESGKQAWETSWSYQTREDTASENPQNSGGYAGARVVGVADDSVAVVVLGGAAQIPTTYGIDLNTRKVAWEKYNFEPQLVQGNTVVGRSTQSGYWDDTEFASMNAQLLALDGKTGREHWKALPETEGLEVRSFSPEILWVENSYPSGSSTDTALSLRTGEVVDIAGFREELHNIKNCSYDAQSITVCLSETTEGHELAGYAAETGKRLWVVGGPTDDSGRTAPEMTTAWHGAVYCEFKDQGTALVLDAKTGKDRELEPGIAPQIVNAYGGLVVEDGEVRFHRAVR